MWLIILSDQLPIVALVSHYLTNKLIGHRPLPEREALRSPTFLLRAYAVLAPLSRRYPPLRGTFRCIPHPFAARRQGCPRAAARLACVKHAASVQSEPGSNSSVRSLQVNSSQRWPYRPPLPRNDKTFGLPPSLETSLTALCEHFVCLGSPLPLRHPRITSMTARHRAPDHEYPHLSVANC